MEYTIIKIFFLLAVIIFAVSVIRSYFPPERTKKLLTHKKTLIGKVIAALMAVMIMSVGYLFNAAL
ncbi:MAG: hypothetical protein P8013_06985 [Candidatus Sulfobium sp.]|jgi:uncharacterized membrane protein YraQ (UPF0718 family)